MASGNITRRAIEVLAATGKPQWLWDAGLKGFGVRVTATGVKSFVYEFRMGGRAGQTRRATIGRCGELTPEAARSIAHKMAERVRNGIDPIDEGKAKLKARADAKAAAKQLAFDAYCARYLEMRVKPDGLASYGNIEAIFRLHAVPHLKAKPLPDIGKRDLVALLDKIPASSPALRRSTYIILKTMFGWAMKRGDIDANPMATMEAPKPAESRDRVLADSELALAWRAAGEMDYPFGPMFRLLMATGQRREEIAALDWREIDQANAQWTLPAARAKNGVSHIVPLNPLAIAELDALARKETWPRKGLVLSTNGRTAISGFSKAKRRIDAIMSRLAADEARELAAWRTHDLRRTLATGLQRLGVRFEVTEAVLNHISGDSKSGVAAVYQRYGWATEKRDALNAWARHVEAILNPTAPADNVTPIRKDVAA